MITTIIIGAIAYLAAVALLVGFFAVGRGSE
jgi:hypothetical protein